MVYKRFTLNIIIQILLISANPVVFIYLLQYKEFYVTLFLIILLWIIQIIYLINFVNSIANELSKFLLSFKYKDSTLVFNENIKDKRFSKLNKSFNHVIKAFSEVKINKEKDYIFYNHIIQNINIALMVIDKDNMVIISNNSFNSLFGKSVITLSDLNKYESNLYEKIYSLLPSNSLLLKLNKNNSILKLKIKVYDMSIDSEPIKFISFQDIKSELDEAEISGWQKMFKIFSHEIGNSISPISLLSSAVLKRMYRLNNNISDKEKEEIIEALEAIKLRSLGLSDFMRRYDKVSHLPVPKMNMLSINNLMKYLKILFFEDCSLVKINIYFKCSDNLKLFADENLLNLLLINLIKNAIYSFPGGSNQCIYILAERKNDKVNISVRDNGCGISDEDLENIFTPFYTTRKNGSGMGLSICKQIMLIHKAKISVSSKIGEGSEFNLEF